MDILTISLSILDTLNICLDFSYPCLIPKGNIKNDKKTKRISWQSKLKKAR
jgi:hypothetical protein